MRMMNPNGMTKLDEIEAFCRERKIFHYCEFVDRAETEAPELAEWASKAGQGVEARTRGICARIKKVRKEHGYSPLNRW